ncbi:unnamed protein product [Schistocephalus solidus]|uniref:Peptidase A1 domain-containing protein n=1 Tax=Schistocephalus solidus TaxID=70667 RepID=A0A183SB94_SCHSO|nr:unnamed protein product [Schistocephalus solidus]
MLASSLGDKPAGSEVFKDTLMAVDWILGVFKLLLSVAHEDPLPTVARVEGAGDKRGRSVLLQGRDWTLAVDYGPLGLFEVARKVVFVSTKQFQASLLRGIGLFSSVGSDRKIAVGWAYPGLNEIL